MMIRNEHEAMQYRRFGKTERLISEITLGGMRFVHGWEQPHDEIPDAMLAHCERVVRNALGCGINHIETAKGYGKSEKCYGIVLNEVLKVPRDSYHLMTKGAPSTAAEARSLVEEQLRLLQTDHIDLYAWHGINTREKLDTAVQAGGAVHELRKMIDEGIIGHLGFSTHGPVDIICEAIGTDLFDFMNVHYYYFFQRNQAAVDLAAMRDMGVFIISPNDKGGQLFNPSQTLSELTAPLTPIQWNARWCLSHPEVHTLSFGLSEPEHFNEMAGIFPCSYPLSAHDRHILDAMDARVSQDPISAYEGYERMPDPSGINIGEVLRFRRMWKCYDMIDFGKYRYNMLQEKGDWFPGCFATDEALANINTDGLPPHIDLKALLKEAHDAFYIPKEEKKN